jgi:glucose/arabinose dehydrogenase
MIVFIFLFPITIGINSHLDSNIEITNVSGGFGKIQVKLKNNDQNELNDIDWDISISGGLLNKINSNNNGVINSLAGGDSYIIESNFIIGFGDIKIFIVVDGVEKIFNGNIFLFFISIKPEKTIDFVTIADGLTSPVAMAHSNDNSGRLFVADQTGKIYVIKDDELLNEPFLDITDKVVDLDTVYDERGLLGITFHPDFDENGRFFVYYSSEKNGENINHESILSEFKVSIEDPNIADPDSERKILRIDQPEANHNGGQLAFGKDGYLYVGLGDGGGAGDVHGNIGNGQDINTILGSIIRLDVDGDEPYVIPSDNPFVGTEGIDEIFAWGFRNPWKFSFDSESDELFVADVGQDNWEEIDIVEKGINYGWRIMEANNPYDIDLADILNIDIETLGKPIYEYNHDVGKSITGGYVYRGTESEEMFGKYIFADWSTSFVRADGKIYYIEESNGIWERYELVPSDAFNRFILSLGEDENGELYLLSKTTLGPSGNSGDVRKIIFN